MKRFLYIAFFFPPLGGAGVQRSLKFTRYLPDLGWLPTVLTGRADYWMQDSSLLAEIPPAVQVLRSPFWGGRFLGGSGGGGARAHGRIRFLRSLARLVFVPDAYLGWVLPAAAVARSALAFERHHAILTTSSPDSVHLLGRHLKRRTGLPWVADFRDPWTRRMAYAPPTPWHDRLQRRLEAACLQDADRVVVTTEETRQDFLARYPQVPAAKVVVIPNGYDEADFTAGQAWLKDSGSAVAGGFSAPILHAGQLNPERPLTPFLAGLRRFVDRNPVGAERARTCFLGGHYDRDVAEVRRFGLEAQVAFASNRPHVESVAALLCARVLLLLEQDSDRGRLVLPGKVFEYLRAGRPILAVVPARGSADRVIRQLGVGWVADPGEPASVAEGIEKTLEMSPFDLLGPTSGPTGSAGSPRPEIAAFERRNLAARLAEVLDSLPVSP